MNKTMNRSLSGGYSPILIIIILVIVLVGASAAAFYILKGQGMLPGYERTPASSMPYETLLPSGSPLPVSESDDIKTLETEINNTNEGSIESDLKQLDSSASSL